MKMKVKLLPPPCPRCGVQEPVFVDEHELRSYEGGALIQDAFPNLSSSERETLLSGYCSSCWDELFPPEDDDLEEEMEPPFEDDDEIEPEPSDID